MPVVPMYLCCPHSTTTPLCPGQGETESLLHHNSSPSPLTHQLANEPARYHGPYLFNRNELGCDLPYRTTGARPPVDALCVRPGTGGLWVGFGGHSLPRIRSPCIQPTALMNHRRRQGCRLPVMDTLNVQKPSIMSLSPCYHVPMSHCSGYPGEASPWCYMTIRIFQQRNKQPVRNRTTLDKGDAKAPYLASLRTFDSSLTELNSVPAPSTILR